MNVDKKDIIVMGGLGVSPRRDRDVDRILHRGGGILCDTCSCIQR